MANRDVALALAAASYPVFPCRSAGPDRKRPESGIFWRGVSTSDHDKVEAFWDRFPLSVPGIDLGKAGYIVIDCDAAKTEGAVNGVPYFIDLCEQHNYPLDEVPIVRTPSGGWHVYFSQPAGQQLTNSRGSLPSKDLCGLDVRGFGGFTIAPGSEFTDGGGAYELIQGRLEDAPVAPDWLVAILTGRREEPAPGPPTAPSPSVSDARLAAYAEAGVTAELARLAGAPKGDRNNVLNAVAFALGQMAGAGWIAAGAAQGWLEEGARTCGLVRDDGIRVVRATIRSGLSDGIAKPRQAPPDRPHANGGDLEHGAALAAAPVAGAKALAMPASARTLTEQDDGTVTDAETGEVIEPAADPATEAFPEALTHVPGLLGEIVDWMTETASKPSRTLNLAMSVAVLAALFGRRFSGPTGKGLRTNLYIMTLAASGLGKTHPMACASELIVDAMQDHLLGGDRIKSDSGLRARMEMAGSVLYILDEVDGHIKPWLSRNAKPHHSNIRDMVMALFSCANGVYRGDDYGAGATEPILNPNLCIYGTTTHARFWRAFEGGTIEDGFLPRLILIDAGTVRPTTVDVGASSGPSLGMISAIQSASGLTGRLNLRGKTKMGLAAWPSVVSVPWGNGGRALWLESQAELDRAQETADPFEQPFIARIAEHGQKLAMVRAIGCDWRQPTISEEDLAWGLSIAKLSVKMMVAQAGDMIADNQAQSDYLRVRRLITNAGSRGLTRGRIVNLLRGALEGRRLTDILLLLQESGDIELADIKPKSGPVRKAYRRLK